jgi:hypothetical protein
MQGRAGEPKRHPKSAHRLLHSMQRRAGEPKTQAAHGEPETRTGFYTQCGAGLENQQKIPRAHTGFYTQCGKGLENQRHHDTLRLLHSERRRAGEPERIPRAHTGFYTQCGKGLENQRHRDTHRLLHSMRRWAGEPERHSGCKHRLLRSMQRRKDVEKNYLVHNE